MNITIVSKSGYSNLVGENGQKFLDCISDHKIVVPVTIITQDIIDKVKDKLQKHLPENTFATLIKMLELDISTNLLICSDDIKTNAKYINQYFTAVDYINNGMDHSKAIEKAFMEE